MADSGTLKIGDRVTHTEWTQGTTRRIDRLYDVSPGVRCAELNEPVLSVDDEGPISDIDKHWMEGGLDLVSVHLRIVDK